MKKNEDKKLTDLLAKAYDALSGIVCEQGEHGLSRYCDPALLGEIAAALGLETGGNDYYAVEYTASNGAKKWGVCTDPRHPKQTWCLTGFSSKEEAETYFKTIVPEAVFPSAA